MKHSEREYFERACRAQERLAKRHGHSFNYPSWYRSEVTGNRVTLRNVEGVIAEYKICPSGRLRRLP